jgi:hypothetical protein
MKLKMWLPDLEEGKHENLSLPAAMHRGIGGI